jgi:Tol biopolymer transport system component
MDSGGDNPRKILALENNDWYGRVRWSPDGRRLAFIRFRGIAGNARVSIETCDLEGANRTVLVDSDPPANGGLIWLPDWRIVYLTGRSAGFDFVGLWQVGIDAGSGKPTGKPRLVTQWESSSVGDLSGSADGKRLVMQRTERQDQIFLGELIAGGMRMNPPRQLAHDEANAIAAAWTPDGKSVLFVSDRNGPWGIFRQAIGQETAEPVVLRSQDLSSPRLSADGAWILFLESPKERIVPASTHRLMRVPVTGGAPQFVMETNAYVNFSCAMAPASRCVVLEEGQEDKLLWTLTEFDPIKGRGNVLKTIEKGRSAHDFIKDPSTYDFSGALSPDGMTFAIARGGEPDLHMGLLALSGGADREITVKSWPDVSGLEWSPDGRSIFCGSRSQQGATLLRVDLNGSAKAFWRYKGAGRVEGIPSPDGRHLAISALATHGNLWMIENF